MVSPFLSVLWAQLLTQKRSNRESGVAVTAESKEQQLAVTDEQLAGQTVNVAR